MIEKGSAEGILRSEKNPHDSTTFSPPTEIRERPVSTEDLDIVALK